MRLKDLLFISLEGNVEQVSKTEEPVSSLTKRPEVIDDYIRNFLSSKGLFKSLDSFQVP
jgi:hypothetical protein